MSVGLSLSSCAPLEIPHHHCNRFWPFFRDCPSEPVPEEKLLDFMVQGKINRGRHTDHLAGRHSIRTTSAHLHHPPIFVQAGCPSCRPTNSVKALQCSIRNSCITKQQAEIAYKSTRICKNVCWKSTGHLVGWPCGHCVWILLILCSRQYLSSEYCLVDKRKDD